MKFIDEFRNSSYCKTLVKSIQSAPKWQFNIMEVCGTHTMSIFKYGISDILPPNIKLISGPGCPVCVTPQSYIDTAIKLSYTKDIIIATFGDMLRVPGKNSSLLKRKCEGGDIRIVYSPMDALKIAENNPLKNIVFLSIGFETTTPMTTLTAIEAKKSNIKNLFFLTSHKIVPPVLKALVEDKNSNVNGFLLPGHVSAIIGENPYRFLPNIYKIPGVITGFEAVDILQSINVLINLISNKDYKIVNAYKRVVKPTGNIHALKYINKTFKITDSTWRGMGIIPKSGCELNEEYEMFDAAKHFKIKYENSDENPNCRCGEVLKGKIIPISCPLFKKSCTFEHPIGPCMVSTEGTCAAYYKYYKEV